MKSSLFLVLTLITGVSLLHSATPGKTQSLTLPDQVPEGLGKSDWASIRSAHTAWEHSFMPLEGGGFQARNKGQQWTTQFDGRGFLAKPKADEWQWGLELRSYGFGKEQRAAKGKPVVKAEGQRLSYQWDADVQEWFVNDKRGLEHGFTLARRPDGAAADAALDVVLGTRGTLKSSVAADAQTVYFRDALGAPVVTYAGLKVWDADGRILPSRFLAGPEGGIILRVQESTARYPLTIDPIAQQAYVKANIPLGYAGVGELFGWSVAVSGDTVVVGAYGEDSSTTGINSTPNEGAPNIGAAYVFLRSGVTWSQQAYLKASQIRWNDQFGYSVAVDGDTVVVGANLENSSTTGINSTPNESAVDAGAAYVFVRSGVTWSQQAYLKASQVTGNDQFGISVAVDGDAVVVGAAGEDSSTPGVNSTPNEGATDAGAAFVFVRSSGTWSQQAYLKASQVSASDRFGTSVAVSGDTVVVGALGEDSSTTDVNSTPDELASNAGAAYVFVRSGVTWSQQAYLKASQVSASDTFGRSVAVSGDTMVVGAPFEDSSTPGINDTADESASSAGAAYVFVRSGVTWSQQAYLKASQVTANDQFGVSVAVSGDTVVVGAPQEDSSSTSINGTPNESAPNAGAAYVFVRSGVAWSQQAYLKPSLESLGYAGADDQFGNSVAVSGDTVVVGADREDSSTPGINSTPDELATSAGAAYVFVRSGVTWSQQAYLKASQVSAADQFGISVAVSGDTVVVGALNEDSSTPGINGTPNEGATNAGAAYVFVRNSGTWSQQAYLKASQVTEYDWFGRSVAVSGDMVVVGAIGEDSSATGINSTPNEAASDAGAAYVFVRSGVTWTQQAYLKAGQVSAADYFGYSVAVSGDTVIAGAPYENSSTTGINSTPNESAPDSGAAYVFVRSGGTWTQQAYLKAHQVTGDDEFGNSVAVSGDTVVVGATGENSSTSGINSTPNEGTSSAGAAYVFVRNGVTWSQQAYLKASQVTEFDDFGYSVAVSGDTVVVGASREDSNTSGINSTPNDTDGPSFNAGAAYVFVRDRTTWSQQAYLKASEVTRGDQFGWSVGVSGDTVVVGAIYEDSNTLEINSTPNEGAYNAGAAYIFTGLGPLPDGDTDGLLDSWELTYWPTTTGHGPLDDHDKDGYVELLELAFGLNPTLPNPGGLPALTEEGGYLTMTITKQPGASYEIQSAATLPGPFSAATTTVLINNSTTLKVRDNVLIGTPPARFMRVQVTAAP